MKFEVKKVDGSVLFEAEIDCPEDTDYGTKLGLAMHWGYKNNKSLKYGNFSGYSLRNLTFTDVDFSGSRFDNSSLHNVSFNMCTFRFCSFGISTIVNCEFYYSEFHCPRFRDAEFEYCKFNNCKFDYSMFFDCDFTESTFDYSKFNRSKFLEVCFHGEIFEKAIFDESTLRNFKHDLWGILARFKNEIPELVRYMKEGKINRYCLMTTLSTIKNLDSSEDEVYIRDPRAPADSWFAMIGPSDTPKNNFASKMALQWIEELMEILKK